MRIRVLHVVCYRLCPYVFEENAEGKSVLVEEYQQENAHTGEVPDESECVEKAAESCPVDAIELQW